MLNKFNIPQSYATVYEHYYLPKICHRTLIAADTHCPYHNIAAIDAMFNYCQTKKIDSILLNGDFMDFHKLSKFIIDPRMRSFNQELEGGNQLLDSFIAAFPNAKIVFKEGNHDERYERYLKCKAAELIGVEGFSLDNHLKLYARGIDYVRDKRIVYAGKLPIFHGHEINMRSNIVNPARTLFLKIKMSGVCSHLHIPSQHSCKRGDDHIVSTWSTGHLSDEHPEWSRINDWILGFAIIDFDEDIYEVSNFKIIHNKIYRT